MKIIKQSEIRNGLVLKKDSYVMIVNDDDSFLIFEDSPLNCNIYDLCGNKIISYNASTVVTRIKFRRSDLRIIQPAHKVVIISYKHILFVASITPHTI